MTGEGEKLAVAFSLSTKEVRQSIWMPPHRRNTTEREIRGCIMKTPDKLPLFCDNLGNAASSSRRTIEENRII